MRVALVCPYAWDRPGGVQTHIRSLARVLGARGHDVTVLAPSLGRIAGDGVTIVGRAVTIPANGSVAPLSFGPMVAARTRRALDAFRPDVVHAHEPLIPSVSLLALLGASAPVVGTFHAAAERSIGYMVGKPLLERAADRLAARTAVSDPARSLIARYLPGDYALTPNGVEIDAFKVARPADLGPGKKVVFLGRLERRKGLEVLIQAMTRLRTIDAELVVAGGGPEEKRARALARRLMVPARFLGRVGDDAKASLLARADVYCAPGLGGESFGIVLVEAMAAGAPIVCSSLAGFAAVAGNAAVLVEPGDPGYLADALRRVLGDDGLTMRMRKASRRTASGFDWHRLVGNVEGIYSRVAEGAIRAIT
jgi:phosphatidyl-myo-inositol alpha-mannosyltransferase